MKLVSYGSASAVHAPCDGERSAALHVQLMSKELLNQIQGQQLSAVCFVLDYYQFQFDGLTFTVLTPVTVESEGQKATSGEDQYRNRVCEQIAKVVWKVDVLSKEAILVCFEDGSSLRFSLDEADYPGPEAVIFNGGDNVCVVF